MLGARYDGQMAALEACQWVIAASTPSGPLVEPPDLRSVTDLLNLEIASSSAAVRGLVVRPVLPGQNRIVASLLPDRRH